MIELRLNDLQGKTQLSFLLKKNCISLSVATAKMKLSVAYLINHDLLLKQSQFKKNIFLIMNDLNLFWIAVSE